MFHICFVVDTTNVYYMESGNINKNISNSTITFMKCYLFIFHYICMYLMALSIIKTIKLVAQIIKG